MKSDKLVVSKQSFWKKKNLLAALIVVLLAAGGSAWYFLGGAVNAQAQSTTQTAAQTYTTSVKRGNISVSTSGSGTLVASQSVDLSFSTTGTVSEVKVKIGEMVKAGDVLARMGKAEDLEANVASAQLTLLQAQKTLTQLQQNASLTLAQAYQDWVTAQGTYNTDLNTSQRTTLARCSQEVNTRYKTILERATEVLNEVTKKDYGSEAWITARNDFDTAQANYSYCIAYTADEKTSASAALEIAKVSLQLVEQNYNTLKATSGIDQIELALDESKVKQATTQLAKAEKELAGITLTASIDGKVVYLAAGAGTIVDTSKFITIADVSKPTINLSVDETDIDKLTVGSTASIVFDALPDQSFTGKVTQVDPQMTTSGQYRVATGQVQLDANAVKTMESVPLGLNATVTIINKETKNALLVPVTALKKSGTGYTVSVMDSNGQAKTQTVEVGIQDGTNAEITSGLKEGDLVSIGTSQISGSTSATRTSSSSSSTDGQPMPPDGGMPPQ